MSLFGRKEKQEIARLKKQLKICEKIDKNNRTIMENMDKIIELQTTEMAVQDDRIIYRDQKIAELEESKELIRQEKLRLEDRVEELQWELENERDRADRYADAVSASMEYSWWPVPEEKMIEAGFTKTETGWKA